MHEPRNYEPINLDQLRNQSANYHSKIPFQHQIEAFEALSKTFKFGSDKPGSGILVLPTGAGKTFTATRWLSDHVIPKNIKILWLAPSFYLLDQAFDTFKNSARDIPEPKKTLNIRCVSSNPSHAKASSIQLTDDIVMMTISSAINNLHTDAVDRMGNKFETAFRNFIDSCKETGLFVIVDEAHHSPAYGCRNLLIGEKDSALGLRGLFPGLNLLGLTATPTYNDKARRGWLWKIFENKIIYEAKKESLILQGVLARPKYIEVATGKELEVDDKLYDRLVKQHQDLPESIIEYISIRLVEELSKSIESGGDYQIVFSKICPIGWYKTEIVYADADNQHESMESFCHGQARYGKYYSTWEVSLYAGNNPEWLLQHKQELLNFIQYQIGYTYIEDIKVNVSNKN